MAKIDKEELLNKMFQDFKDELQRSKIDIDGKYIIENADKEHKVTHEQYETCLKTELAKYLMRWAEDWGND